MKQLRPAIVVTLFFILAAGFAFPLAITGLAQAIFPKQANGSMIVQDGKVVGSELIGQSFTADRFFHPRPSAAGAGYDANASGGANLGPTNAKLLSGADGFDGVQQLAQAYRAKNGVSSDVILPVDAVTRSASGLDPHISASNARLQAKRVSQATGIAEARLEKWISEQSERGLFGFGEEPFVNVLKLNLIVSNNSRP